jgi:hypothetical protein
VAHIFTVPEAVAAVVTAYPRYAGYALLAAGPAQTPTPLVVGPGGVDHRVFGRHVEGGFRVIFATGGGDCPAGCTSFRFDVFFVNTSGPVLALCSLDQGIDGTSDARLSPAGALAQLRSLVAADGDPCAGG